MASRSALRLSRHLLRHAFGAPASSAFNSSWRRLSSAIWLAAAVRRASQREASSAIAARRRRRLSPSRLRLSSAARASPLAVRASAVAARASATLWVNATPSPSSSSAASEARRRLLRRFHRLFQAADFRFQAGQRAGALGGGAGGAGAFVLRGDQALLGAALGILGRADSFARGIGGVFGRRPFLEKTGAHILGLRGFHAPDSRRRLRCARRRAAGEGASAEAA